MVSAATLLHERGFNPGASGNLSVRIDDRILITPSGVDYPTLAPSEIVELSFDGTASGLLRPSSEWRFHRDVYQARSEVEAIVHTHQPLATAVSCLRRDVPAVHYMIAAVGGPTIRCAPYATFGTQGLSDHVVEALQGRTACLLSNHGLVAVGANVEDAAELAYSVEALCDIYLNALRAGEPVILSEAEMAEVMARFATYGHQDRPRFRD